MLVVHTYWAPRVMPCVSYQRGMGSPGLNCVDTSRATFGTTCSHQLLAELVADGIFAGGAVYLSHSGEHPPGSVCCACAACTVADCMLKALYAC